MKIFNKNGNNECMQSFSQYQRQIILIIDHVHLPAPLPPLENQQRNILKGKWLIIGAETNRDEALTFMSITSTETFFIRITRSEIPQSRLWQNHSKGWYRANPSLFGTKLIDTRQKSMNDKHYTKETLDFHIQPAKAAFYWLAFFQSYPGISLFVFPRIETKNANQSNKLVCD